MMRVGQPWGWQLDGHHLIINYFVLGDRVVMRSRSRWGDRNGPPTRDHVHALIRTPNGNDYGKDLLRQHYERHPHPDRH